ncbi:chromosome segregation protein SMC [Nesterenkonia aerolata]|uniref:Chromosome partition protein Smc n=1 Tax=Nesterenkonia aerolata TaxID=3074079 RepID=A0ABU2DT72_9MICC|nr:chromosome segregation protein SMC [Nesterenkonia sp. LY-0111]MDR8019575.1 chromosome segregation protein SMC [Nesterenkonia sp. LY-0111]
MHLKTLTVRGFKSFASATTFAFEPGVTAVVGPNGSGKSNVVDALAWVMGEQGAKSLRGGSMEDVIFAGTAERQPLGRAQVALTIDNADGALPIEYSEVTISRTMFRTGGSEYTINGRKCRLLDIQELLSDSGLGREMHVIVGQGQLDQILQATPEQRRGFIEEAAGVLKHRRRRERSVRKLESMQGNLDRLEDLISEISRQLAPLGRQAKVARRAQRIQYDVRDALSRLIADDLIAAATALDESSRGEESDRARAAQLRENIEAQDTEIAALQARADTAQQTVRQLVSGHHRLAQAQERLRSTASVAAERARSLFASAVIEDSGRDPEDLRRQAAQVEQDAAAQKTETDDAAAALTAASEVRAAAEEQLRAEETRVTELLRAAADRRAGLATLRGRVEAAQGRIDAAAVRRQKAESQREEAERTRQEAAGQFAELEQAVAGIETGEADLDTVYETARRRHEELTAAQQQREATRRRLDAAVGEHRATLNGLTAARTPKDGAAALRERAPEEIAAVLGGPLADQLQITAGWETAIAACLGSLETALVADGPEAAAAAVRWLGAEQGGRAHLVHPEPEGSSTTPELLPLPEGACWALGVVSVPQTLATALIRRLTGTVLVLGEAEGSAAHQDGQLEKYSEENSDEAPDLEALLSREDVDTVATASGELIRAAERIGGTALAGSDLALNARIQEATAACEADEQQLREISAAIEAHADQLQHAEAEADRALEALHANDAELTAVTDQLARLSAESERAAERTRSAEAEIAEAERIAEEATGERHEAQSRLQAAESQDVDEDPSTDERDRLAEQASARRGEEVDARLSLRAAEETHAQLLDRAAGLRRSAAAEENRREQARRAAEQRTAGARRAEGIQTRAEAAVEELHAVLSRAEQAQQEGQAEHRALTEEIAAAQQARSTDAAALEEITDRLHRAEVRRTELRLALESAEQRGRDELSLSPEYLIEHYGPDQLIPDPDSTRSEPAQTVQGSADPGAAQNPVEDPAENPAEDTDTAGPAPAGYPYDRAEQEARLVAARRDLKALGKVNPLALEEHAALEERHTYLQEQLADVQASRQDLLDLIADVDATVQTVFTEAWEDTRRQFEHVFSRLFPGGEGRLELTDPEDMLHTGIEVHARPPGKRIRRLSLLSGGERSLTAVALLVAIFKARPSPFYVMDEVEAALDDTNLSRLLVIFEELRESSQLIVITHQKRTMEIADALYGVSMRQDGSTRVVSQRLRRDGSVEDEASAEEAPAEQNAQ